MEGKKNTAFNIFYNALDRVAKQTGENGYEVWKKALNNVTPSVEVRSRRIGGATFQIPSEVRPDRKISLSMKWLIRYSRERNGRSMAEKLANEIIAASKGEGAAFKKKKTRTVWRKPTRLLPTSEYRRRLTIKKEVRSSNGKVRVSDFLLFGEFEVSDVGCKVAVVTTPETPNSKPQTRN